MSNGEKIKERCKSEACGPSLRLPFLRFVDFNAVTLWNGITIVDYDPASQVEFDKFAFHRAILLFCSFAFHEDTDTGV